MVLVRGDFFHRLASPLGVILSSDFVVVVKMGLSTFVRPLRRLCFLEGHRLSLSELELLRPMLTIKRWRKLPPADETQDVESENTYRYLVTWKLTPLP